VCHSTLLAPIFNAFFFCIAFPLVLIRTSLCLVHAMQRRSCGTFAAAKQPRHSPATNRTSTQCSELQSHSHRTAFTDVSHPDSSPTETHSPPAQTTLLAASSTFVLIENSTRSPMITFSAASPRSRSPSPGEFCLEDTTTGRATCGTP
jgi:hypothetical protein